MQITEANNGKHIKFSAGQEELHELWQVIAPDLQRHILYKPLWQMLTFAYMLGAYHALSLRKDSSEVHNNAKA